MALSSSCHARVSAIAMARLASSRGVTAPQARRQLTSGPSISRSVTDTITSTDAQVRCRSRDRVCDSTSASTPQTASPSGFAVMTPTTSMPSTVRKYSEGFSGEARPMRRSATSSPAGPGIPPSRTGERLSTRQASSPRVRMRQTACPGDAGRRGSATGAPAHARGCSDASKMDTERPVSGAPLTCAARWNSRRSASRSPASVASMSGTADDRASMTAVSSPARSASCAEARCSSRARALPSSGPRTARS